MKHERHRGTRNASDMKKGSTFVLLVQVVFVTACVARAVPAKCADDSRVVWEYSGARGKSWLVHESGKKWIAWRGNSASLIHVEEERNSDFIQLRGVASGLQLRLYTGRGEIKQVADTLWKRWSAVGNWVNRDALPDTAASFPGYQIRVVYFVPSDREPVDEYEAKIRVLLAYVEELYRSSLSLRRTPIQQLPFEREHGEIKVHLVSAEKPASYFNAGWEKRDGQQVNRIVEYLRTHQHDPSRRVTLVIPETWEDGPADEGWPGHEARGANYSPDGGIAVYSAWILQDRFCATTIESQRTRLFDRSPVIGRRSFTLRKPDSPVFEFVENGIGGVAHELAHAFGLPHDRRDPRNIMGTGFRRIQANFLQSARPSERAGFSIDNARLLMSSRYFADDLDLQDFDPPQVGVEVERSRRQGRHLFTLKLDDDTGLRAGVILRLDGASNVLVGMALRGRTQIVREVVDTGINDETREFRVLVTDDGGNMTTKRIPVSQVP